MTGTHIDWQTWIPVLQIQIAATMVMLAAACLERFVAPNRIVAREWLWRGALVGVLASPLVPLFNRVVPKGGPELAILRTNFMISRTQVALHETDPVDTPASLASIPQSIDTSNTNSPASQSTLALLSLPLGSMMDSSDRPAAAIDERSIDRPSADVLMTRVAPQDWILGTILVCWLTGVLYHLARGLRGLVICRRIVATAIPLDHGRFDDVLLRLRRALSLNALPPISATSKVSSPAVVGTISPHIVLPVESLGWMSSVQLFHVLLHEAGHIVRRDPLINSLQMLAKVFFWHHPMVHWLNRRLSQAREEVCDNFVLMHTAPADYAETLLEMTEKCPRVLAISGLAIFPAIGSLEDRVTRLLDGMRDRSIHWPLWRKLGMVSVLALVPLFLGLIRVTERDIRADESKSVSDTDKANVPVADQHAAKPKRSVETGTGRISGRVVFENGSHAASNAKVVLLPPPPNGQEFYIGLLPLVETTADSDGRFSFDSLAPGSYRVWANFGKQTSRKQARNGAPVKLEDGGEPPKPVELKLSDGVAVSVKATDKSTGKLIANATVRPGWSDLVGDFRADGHVPVIVQPLTPERWFLEIWADGYAKESRWLNLENGKDAIAEFQLVPGGNLEGVVRDPSGKPVENAGLSVRYEGDFNQLAWIETDAQGRYEFDHLPIGRGLNISVSKVDWVAQTVPAKLTAANQKLDVKLAPRPHGGTVVGVVRDSKGKPIAEALLTNYGTSSSEVRETTSDAQGRFKLDNLYAGSTGTEVIVRAKKFAPLRLPVKPGPANKPNEISIKLNPGHRIVGRVTNEVGRPLSDVTIYFANGNGPFSMGGKGTTDTEGKFEFDSLPSDCPFTFQKSGFSSIENRKFSLDTDEVVTVEMVPVGIILGKVIDRATKKPISKFNVRLTFSQRRSPSDPIAGLRGDWVKPGQAFQSDDGGFKLGELVAGMPLEVMVDASGYETAVDECIVAARSGDAREVEFEMVAIDTASSRKYSGQIVDAIGKPVADAQLRLIVAAERSDAHRTRFPFNWQMIQSGQIAQMPKILRFLEGTTDKDGQFAFTGVPRNAQAELVWWGEHVVSGRSDHLETLDENASIQIELPNAVRITGKLDRKTFPKIGSIDVSPQNESLQPRSLELKPDQKEFEFKNLAPGKYTVSLMSPLERRPGLNEETMTNRRLSSMVITLDDEETVQIDFTKGNTTPDRGRPTQAK